MSETRQPVSLFGTPTLVSEPVSNLLSESLSLPPKNNPVTTVTVVPNGEIAKKAQQYDLSVVDEQAVVLFASDRQREVGVALDGILAEITKEQSPILFELFRQLKKGIEDTDLGAIEEKIKKSQEKGFFGGLLDSVGLSSVTKRMEAASEEIGKLLTSKSKSLLDLTRDMETKLQAEVMKLITNSKQLNTLAATFRQNITAFGEYVDIGKIVLENGKSRLVQLQAHAASTNNPLDIEAARLFEQKVNLFETRLLTIETIYQKAPAELEAIRLSQGASLATLGETANSALEEFNDIKSILIKLSVSHQIQSVQGINQQRRELRDKLQTHGTNLLGQTAEAAAKAQGENRVQDASKLLLFAQNLKAIDNKVEEQKRLNQDRFKQARESLAQVKQLVG